MTYYLENENLKRTVYSQGVELKSIVNKTNQQELLWQADPEFCGKSSPVLLTRYSKCCLKELQNITVKY